MYFGQVLESCKALVTRDSTWFTASVIVICSGMDCDGTTGKIAMKVLVRYDWIRLIKETARTATSKRIDLLRLLACLQGAPGELSPGDPRIHNRRPREVPPPTTTEAREMNSLEWPVKRAGSLVTCNLIKYMMVCIKWVIAALLVPVSQDPRSIQKRQYH